MNKINVLDTEASGLMNGYPIQIGVISKDGKEFMKYIKPHDEWLSDLYWDFNAECIHNIELSFLLENGDSVFNVASELNKFMKEDIIYCDSPYDIMWINLLYEFADLNKTFELRYIFDHYPKDYLEHWELVFNKINSNKGFQLHNALDDAKMIQRTFDYITQHLN